MVDPMALVRRVMQGDTQACNELAGYWLTLGSGYAQSRARRGMSFAELEELVSEAVVKALRKAKNGEVKSSPDGMFLRTLMGEISHHLEHEGYGKELKERVEAGDIDALGWWSDRPPLSRAEFKLREDVQDALDDLEGVEQQLLILVKTGGYSVEKAAEEVGLTLKQARLKLAKAEARFATIALDEDEEDR